MRQEALDVTMQLWYDSKSLHWYTRGRTFFSLHEAYENLAADALGWHDRLAEQFIGLGDTSLRPWASVRNKSGFDEGPLNSFELTHMLDMVTNVKKMLLALHKREDDLGLVNAIEDIVEEVNVWIYKFAQSKKSNNTFS